MILLLSILVILLVVLLLRFGADAAYDADGLRLVLIAGPMRLQLLPKKEKKAVREKKAKAKRGKASKEKKAAKNKPLDLKFLLELAKAGLQALNRFRICLRVDVFHLRFVSGSDDPYKTAMNSAYVTAALNLLAPQARRAFRVKDSQIEVGTDFLAEKPQIVARLALTIQVWQILYVALAFGFEFLGVWRKHKRRTKEKAAVSEAKTAVEAAADEEPVANHA